MFINKLIKLYFTSFSLFTCILYYIIQQKSTSYAPYLSKVSRRIFSISAFSLLCKISIINSLYTSIIISSVKNSSGVESFVKNQPILMVVWVAGFEPACARQWFLRPSRIPVPTHPQIREALGDRLKLQLQVCYTLMATHSSTNYLLFPLEGMDLSMLYQVLPTVLFRCNGMLHISAGLEPATLTHMWRAYVPHILSGFPILSYEIIYSHFLSSLFVHQQTMSLDYGQPEALVQELNLPSPPFFSGTYTFAC